MPQSRELLIQKDLTVNCPSCLALFSVRGSMFVRNS